VSLLFQGPEDTLPSAAAEAESRRQRGESSGIALGCARESGLAIPRGPKLSVSKQHRRAGPSRHQAPLRTDARPQVISYRGCHTCRRGTRASNPEGAVLIALRRRDRTLFFHLWARALKRPGARAQARSNEPQPPTQQNSPVRLRTEHDVRDIEPARYARRVTVSRGLCLFVTPKDGRCWHYRFYFSGKRKKLNLGTYPEISLECAKARHQYARNLLARGINPCEMKATLGKNAFVLRMREWENEQTTAGRPKILRGWYLATLCGLVRLVTALAPLSDTRAHYAA
jgi:hypothetical protein